ncbi:hypothetical protein JK359_11980 [Streptomyces actinomycinicus]|uniref:Uncharacterized protein n=1 Tax=Streptomyces actinomycinicus TaxID=1695166 RepID=A0A937JLQ1_9ACTN|nr:DUF5829 family protein [Streptomyces actinomycinicus]MBL1082690.1 hypothetical protein [Streptomyces actinomycinicus]
MPRLDHVMVLLDEAAYRSAAASAFLARRFGRTKRKEADSSLAGQYSTLGVAGRNTLVECFGTGLPSASPITAGLVFSFEEPGSSQAARELLDATGTVRHTYDLVRRADDQGGERRPWYHLINVVLGEASPVLLFLNEVTPEYFTALGARPGPDGALCRSAYLDAALGAPDDGSWLLRDIVGVTLALRPERARAVAGALAAFGYTVATLPGGLCVEGHGLRLHLAFADGPAERVTEIEMATAENADGNSPGAAEYVFGDTSRLVVEPGRARWCFDEPRDSKPNTGAADEAVAGAAGTDQG